MAKIVITIEDNENGTVKFTMDPTFETMMKMQDSGHKLTSAHGYAISAANHVRSESRKARPTPILIPRIGKA